MIQRLRNKVSSIRMRITSLIEDLQERQDELNCREDYDGRWEEESEEIDNLMYILEIAESDLSDYE